ILLGAQEGGKGKVETHDGADEMLFIRRGSGSIFLGDRRYEIGSGDVVKVPIKMAHHIEVPSGRLEYIAVRVIPASGAPVSGIRPGARNMPDLLRPSEISDTLAKFDSNQPIHSAPNFTMNYVIYKGHAGPFEAHKGCVDIYFIKVGTGAGRYGGQISNAKEDSP